MQHLMVNRNGFVDKSKRNQLCQKVYREQLCQWVLYENIEPDSLE